MNMKWKKGEGFTLIELLVVIAIIGILSSVTFMSLSAARGKARDASRLSDMHALQVALEMYYTNHHTYPASSNTGCGGWETTGSDKAAGKSFVEALVADKDLPGGLEDPDSSLDAGNCGNYRYYFYSASYGCIKPFYVIGVVSTDAYGGSKYPSSPGWSCASRDWQAEMSWAAGMYAN
jgi:prepilin-type N-terminal cleavage/methylation domain-containing protein